MTAPTRLYGKPDDEYLYADPGTVLEHAFDDGLDEIIVVEHTVHEPREHMPSPGEVYDFIYERTCEWGEVTEDYPDRFPERTLHFDQLAEALLDSLADRITYRMADREIGRTTYVHDGNDWKEVQQ